MKNDQENEPTSSSSSPSSSAVAVSEKPSDGNSELPAEGADSESDEEKEKQLETDWKTDEEFKKFMGNPSIEAAIKLEKKRADRKLKDLDRGSSGNPVAGILNKVLRDSLTREKERLEKAEETFKAIDLNKVIFLYFFPLCKCLFMKVTVWKSIFYFFILFYGVSEKDALLDLDVIKHTCLCQNMTGYS